MRTKPHKGSWGDGYIIEPRPNQTRITCNFCKNYNLDGSCDVSPIVISGVGYDYWKYCKSFSLSHEYNTLENREYVTRNKKVRSTYTKEIDVVADGKIVPPWIKKHTKRPKTIKLGSKICVYDKTYDEKVLYKIVEIENADVLKGKISVSSPVGQGLLGAKEGDVCTIETPSGIVDF